ncbi:helix-turn-helix domain-containing protein [Salmonella enterica subsp. enterica serovar Albany]|nr:helix-turn-helix domain-containing protein [Salmonella enterica subsp. enterica serovar Albany]
MAPLEIRHRSVRPISAKHAQASRFLQQSLREIRALLKDGSIPVSDVARRYGVSRTTIYNHVGVVSVQNSRGD